LKEGTLEKGRKTDKKVQKGRGKKTPLNRWNKDPINRLPPWLRQDRKKKAATEPQESNRGERGGGAWKEICTSKERLIRKIFHSKET